TGVPVLDPDQCPQQFRERRPPATPSLKLCALNPTGRSNTIQLRCESVATDVIEATKELIADRTKFRSSVDPRRIDWPLHSWKRFCAFPVLFTNSAIGKRYLSWKIGF